MNILILGPQGSGKGTQGRLLAKKYDLFYFDCGAFLRKLSEKNEIIKKTLQAGKLLPSKELASYIANYFDEKQTWDNIIFDGYPRTLEQYEFFKNWLKDKNMNLDLVIVLKISRKTSIKRLNARRLDPKTGKIYNLITDPPPPDVDQSKLVQREDDKPEAIKKRLEIYHSLTEPFINELKKDTLVFTINAEKPINEIHDEIGRIIDEKVNS